jgi:type I restriction enzyme S subunit
MMSRLVPKLRFKEFSGEWKERKLGDVGNTFNGLTGKTKEDFGIGKPYIQYMQVFSNYKIDVANFGLVTIKPNDRQNKVKYGDIFFTTSSETLKEIGLSSVLTKQVNEVYLNSFCFGYRPKSLDELVPEFSQFFFRNETVRKKIIGLGQGSTRVNISKVKLLELKFYFPEKQEQQKIASCLSSLDALIEAQNKKVSALKQHKKGLMQQLFPAEGKREPKLRFKAFSGEWGEKMLEEIGEISGGGVDKKTNENERPVMLLNYMDVYNKNFIYSYDLKQQTSANNAKIQKCNIEKGDIFFTPSSEVPNDIAKSSVAMESIINGVYSYHLVRLRMFKSLDLKFRTYMFKTNSFFKIVSKLAQGSGTRYTITLPEFRSIKTLIPPPPKEQQKIANTLSTLDSLIEAQNQQINHLKQHKKGLMQQMFVSSEVGV